MVKKAATKQARMQTIEELALDINKALGDNVLIKASAAREMVPRATTGFLALDLSFGGGWAANQWNEIVGEESSGKTALAFAAIAANMERDPDFVALLVAAEQFVPEYADAIGIDRDRLWVVETNLMEPALDLVVKAVKNRAVDMVVIDSLPALVTATEMGKNMDEPSVATGAQILSRFFRKCGEAQRRSLVDPDDRPCTLIVINQWRDKIGVMFGDPRTTPGGKAKNYYFFIRVETARDEWIKEGSDLSTRVGQTIATRTIKNKTYRSSQRAQVDFYFADSEAFGFKIGQFDKAKDVVNVALALELFDEGTRYKYKGEKVGASKEELLARVREDIGLRDSLVADAHALMLPATVPVQDDELEPTEEELAAELEEDFR